MYVSAVNSPALRRLVTVCLFAASLACTPLLPVGAQAVSGVTREATVSSATPQNRVTAEQIEQRRQDIQAQAGNIQKNLEAIQQRLIEAQQNVEAARKKAESAQNATADAVAEFDAAQRALDRLNEVQPPALTDLYKQQLQVMQRIGLLYDRQIADLNQAQTLRQTRAQLDESLETLRRDGPPEKPPYTFLQLDALRDEAAIQAEKSRAAADALKTAEDQLLQARKQADENDAALSLLKESFENVAGPPSPLDSARLSLALLEKRRAQEAVLLGELDRDNQRLNREIAEKQQALLDRRVELIQKETLFREAELNEQLDRLQAEGDALEDQVAKVVDAQNKAVIQLDAARRKSAAEPSPVNQETELACQLERDGLQKQIEFLNERRGWVNERIELWKRRYAVFNNTATPKELRDWLEHSKDAAAEIEKRIPVLRDAVFAEGKNRNTIQAKLENVKDDAALQKIIQRQIDAEAKLIQYYSEYISAYDNLRRLHVKLSNEIQKATETWSLSEAIEVAGEKIGAVLDYSLMNSRNEDDEIVAVLTVRKVVYAVIYLVIGLWLARWISVWLFHHLLQRFGVHEGAAVALQKLAYYLLLVIVISYTLKAVNIPLTAFAFLGGALAIGIGFGSQNILNNFISGLILLMERQVRVGDLIQIEGTSGRVLSIGARCTKVLTFDNIDLLIPNSTLLETRVINMTLSDNVIRASVSVGVAYGTNTRDAAKLILKAVEEHGLILKHPEPYVLFESFGDNSLNFLVYFWVQMIERNNRLVIQSDIRHRINRLFEDAGIVIAFPQRDVHLDAGHPIPIRMVRDDDSSGSGGASA